MNLFRKAMPPALSKVAKGVGAGAFTSPIAPDQTFIAIGDIHGNLNALESLISEIESAATVPQIVCVGDYIDRGDESAAVLSWLKRLNEEFGSSFVCIRGNHEQMLLRFLDDPESHGPRWLRHGGLQALASYKVQRTKDSSHQDLRDALARAMGPDMVQWLADLPLYWQSGNVAVVHAGADPNRPINLQDSQVLQWGHPDFQSVTRTDGIWVVHGHTIVDQPWAGDGRISIDTGAYATGVLTAAEISRKGVRFLSSQD